MRRKQYILRKEGCAIYEIWKLILETLIPAACLAICTMVATALKGYRSALHATETGVKSLLRSEIIRAYEKYTERGYFPIYAREPLARVYEAYHALGGNSTATDLYQKTVSLPTEPSENE